MLGIGLGITHITMRQPCNWWPVGATLALDIPNKHYAWSGDINPANAAPGQLSTLFSTARATPAWAEDSAGNLIEFAPNTLCLTDKGLWTQGADTNLWLDSDGFPGNNLKTTPPPVNNSAADRAGGQTAWTVPAGATGICQRNLTIPADTASYVWSMDCHPLAAGARLSPNFTGVNGVDAFSVGTYDFDTDSWTGDTMNVIKHANGWYTFWRVFTNNGAGTIFVTRLDMTPGTTEKLAYWNINLKVGTFPTSRIKTSSAPATRAADDIDFTDVSWHNPSAGTFVINAERLPKYSAGFLDEDDGTIFSMGKGSGGSAHHWNLSALPSDEQARMHWGKLDASPNPITVTNNYGAAKTWVERHVIAYQLGQPIRAASAGLVTDPVGGTPYEDTDFTFARIGRGSFGAPYAFAWIKDITYYPTAMTAAQMQALSLSPSAGNVHMLGDSFVQQTMLDALRHQMMDEYRAFTFDGVGGTTLAQQKVRFDATPDKYDRILLIWDGGYDSASVQEATDAIDAMVAHLSHTKWAYVEPDGAMDDATLASIVSHINTAHGPGHYIPTLAALQAANDGSANDLADVAAGLVPRSLRSDSIHLNDAGKTVATREIKSWLAGV